MPLPDRVEALAQKGRKIDVSAALRALRKCMPAHTSLGLRLVKAIANARRASPQQLLEAGRTMGPTFGGYAELEQLWERAWRARAPSYLRSQIAEGYVDALLAKSQTGAKGAHDRAKTVLDAALRRAPAGARRGLLERLVAWGRLTGALEVVEAELARLADPDAAVLLARIAAEARGEDAGLAVLKKAWRRYPGHRWLQAEYLKLLARLGYRDQLQEAVAKVVRLAPGDPMPYVQVLDAHIGARDVRKARKLIDRLASQYPRHDVLIESLIDREQRLGDDAKRIGRLYETLLKAAPKTPSYAEAYAEWLLGRHSREHGKAMAVLKRLIAMSGDRGEGERRAASILQAHGFTAEALKLLQGLRKRLPDDPAVKRQLALLLGQIGRDQAAEQLWKQLAALPEAPNPAQRQLAAEARRNLLSMYRRSGLLAALRPLLAVHATGKMTLGDLLLLLDVHRAVHEADLAPADLPGLDRLTAGTHASDPEVLARVAARQLRAGKRAAALSTLTTLAKVEPSTAEPLLLGLVQRALMAGDSKVADGAEAVLRTGEHVPTSLLLRLGNLRLRHGDRKAAAALFRHATAQNPRDTRAVYRLAQLHRHAGDGRQETLALRQIVLRTTDNDELEKAGQRLLTLAMGTGTCADLLAWLDAIAPQHPRRSLLQRFRLLAYDAWLRTEPLERAVAGRSHRPQPALLSEALSGGDLAMKVRALRQIARAGRMLPRALAQRLLKDSNAVVRRDTVLALAASGSKDAANLLVEMEAERGAVLPALLMAFGRLPAVDPAMALLEDALMRRRGQSAELAALALGRVGQPPMIGTLIERLRNLRSGHAATCIALGNLVGRFPESPDARRAVAALATMAAPDGHNDNLRALFTAYAALWALAATGREDAREVLLDRAAGARAAIVRRLSLRFAGAKPPSLAPDLWDMELRYNEQNRIARKLLRRLITPWLSPNPEADEAAMAQHGKALAARLGVERTIASPGSTAGKWCQGMQGALDGDVAMKTWCAPALSH